MKNTFKLIVSFLVCGGVGFLGSLFTTPAISDWYDFLMQPDITPPNWVFGVVWTILFFLMGVSLYLVWKETGKDKRRAIIIFFIQLVLNLLWSILFFGLQNPLLALIEIVVLFIAILATIVSFLKINKTAAFLLLPYLAWVGFATVLNYFFYVLNF